MVQLRIEQERRSANLVRALQAIEQVCEMTPAPDLICLPECCDVGPGTPVAHDCPCELFTESLGDRARDLGVFVAAGLTELVENRIYNSAVLIDPDGDVIARHRQINVATGLRSHYSAGRRIEVVETFLGNIGLAVGSDMSSPVAPCLGAMGAHWVICPLSTIADPPAGQAEIAGLMETLGRAARTGRYGIVAAGGIGNVEAGPLAGKVMIGNSMLFAANGECIRTGSFDEATIVATLTRFEREENHG